MIETTDISRLLTALYGFPSGDALLQKLLKLANHYETFPPRPKYTGLSHKDAFLITYPDQLHEPGVAPLSSLAYFCSQRLKDVVSSVHILPFFPSSSDDGFSVIDYRQVDPQDGSWQDITNLEQNFRIMVDGVFNHVSAQSAWFQGFLEGNPTYTDFFIVVEDNPDLSQVVRPAPCHF